jgi:predicted XRE-type DNA-binding protein
MNTRTQEALTLAQLGWSVLPLAPNSKHPLARWRSLQQRQLGESEIVQIFEQNPNANVGVVTGRVSNLLVLDADAPDAIKKWGVPVTPISETARGRHYYFQLPDVRIRSATGLADGLDVRAEGGYVVAPPSVHPTGKPYEWVIPPFEADPAPPPAWLLEMLRKQRKQQNYETISEIVRGVEEGRRNVSAAALTGKLLGALPPHDWEIVWVLLESWNEKNKPPLDKRELRRVFESIAKRELRKRANSESKEELLARAVTILLEHSDLSQRELARLLNISKSKLSRLINTPNTLTTNTLNPPSGVSGTIKTKSPQLKPTFKRECPTSDWGVAID